MNNLSLTITSAIGNIVNVQYFVEQLTTTFSLPKKLYRRTSLATVEAVSNAILHGNQNDPQKQVIVKVWIKENTILVSVEDQGKGFDCTVIPDPTTPGHLLQPSGRGLYLMKTLSDSLAFENNGSRVLMSFVWKDTE